MQAAAAAAKVVSSKSSTSIVHISRARCRSIAHCSGYSHMRCLLHTDERWLAPHYDHIACVDPVWSIPCGRRWPSVGKPSDARTHRQEDAQLAGEPMHDVHTA